MPKKKKAPWGKCFLSSASFRYCEIGSGNPHFVTLICLWSVDGLSSRKGHRNAEIMSPMGQAWSIQIHSKWASDHERLHPCSETSLFLCCWWGKQIGKPFDYNASVWELLGQGRSGAVEDVDIVISICLKCFGGGLSCVKDMCKSQVVSPQKYVQILTPGTYECDLTWKESLHVN